MNRSAVDFFRGVLRIRTILILSKMFMFRAARLSRLAAWLSLALVLVACPGRSQASDPAAEGQPFQVVTTFLPITLFTRAVAGDCATVTPLIPPNMGPHDFQATSGDLATLRGAQVLIKNGLGMEHFLDKLIASAENPELVVIDSSRDVATLDSPEEAGHGHEHGHGHGHGEVNPHIWLDPLRAAQQVETIRDGLVKEDPGCAAGYRRNAAAYTASLRDLNTELAGQLKPYTGKTFIAFHDFAPYFAQRYNLKADFLVDVPEMSPTPRDLQRVAAKVRATQLKALLTEPQEGERSFNALAKDLGVTISVFDPLETGSEQASQAPSTYVAVMRANGANLVKAFGGTP